MKSHAFRLAPKQRSIAGAAVPGDFVLQNRLGACLRGVWMAVLDDLTEVIVTDVQGVPSPLGVEKAAAVVQSRAHLEGQARLLLVPFTKDRGHWSLVTIDFGVEARRRDCEFLMCFAFQAANGQLSVSSPYVEVGFALPLQPGRNPLFTLSVCALGD